MKKFFLILMMLTFTIGTGWADDLYILGMVNGNGTQPNQGVQMTYDEKNNVYTADIWVIGNDQNEMGVPGTWFAFTTVLANDDNIDGWNYVNGNRYSPSPNGDYWWLNYGPTSDIPLTKQNNDKAFLIPAGLYSITVAGDLSSFSLVEVKDFTPIITPESGDYPLNTIVAVSLSDNYNEFIAECNPVVDADNKIVEGIESPVVRLYVNDILSYAYALHHEMYLDTPGENVITGRSSYVLGDVEYITKSASKTYNVYQIFNATIESTSITGGIVSFSATDPTNTSILDIPENYVVNLFVTPGNNRELKSLTYTPEDGSAINLLKNGINEDGIYSFNMPKANVTINASFDYNGPEPTETTYELVSNKTDNAFEVGARYLIVNENNKKALGGPANSAIDITIGKEEHFTIISSDSDVAQFVLAGSDKDGWSFESEYGYLKLESNNTDITQFGTSEDTWTITIDDSNNATILSTVNDTRLISYNRGGNYFRTMADGGRDYPVQLYKEVIVNNDVTVTGTITDKKTEEPIEGVEVTLTVNPSGKADQITYTAVSDANGVYSMDVTPIEGATYDMAFEKEGYFSQTIENVDITKPQNAELDPDNIITGISNINADNVVSVKYLNALGQTSDCPFNGINIVVTRYTDGRVSTSKIIK